MLFPIFEEPDEIGLNANVLEVSQHDVYELMLLKLLLMNY